ncbi:glycosyltransferase family 4 protein [Desemzia sp. RIT804]|uniref:glycosyltransferase family 4 protein n=1 Tax=Desemzia sp. RIT 804 TaxID=2810209 RepID=UPI0019527E4B|nr:glycosyltransferase family 4 protein [Desemzia sp. RIT 804]MBM6614820.1 glycosyltransferase family 4 protein [Desemzia sp. RIT 804]
MSKALVMASVAPMISSFNRDNIRLLQEMGLEVHVLANFAEDSETPTGRNEQFRQELEANGVTVFDVAIDRNPLKKINLQVFFQIKKIFDQEQYVLIHCHSPIGGVLTRLAAAEARKSGTKVIYTAHGFHFFNGAPRKNWLLYYPVEKWLARYTDCLITINGEDYEAAHLRKFKAGYLTMMDGVGIDQTRFTPTEDVLRGEVREKLGFPQDAFILIYVGELCARKNQQVLIEAAKLLTPYITNLKLLIVGNGDKKESYTQQISELGIEEQVELLGYRGDVHQLMQMSDVVVSSSKQEGLPVNIMEGMATGLPLVVSNCRGNRDLVRDGQNGFVVEKEDAALFAEAIKTLYASKPLRETFGAQSLELIQQYGIKNISIKMKTLYQETLQMAAAVSLTAATLTSEQKKTTR